MANFNNLFGVNNNPFSSFFAQLRRQPRQTPVPLPMPPAHNPNQLMPRPATPGMGMIQPIGGGAPSPFNPVMPGRGMMQPGIQNDGAPQPMRMGMGPAMAGQQQLGNAPVMPTATGRAVMRPAQLPRYR